MPRIYVDENFSDEANITLTIEDECTGFWVQLTTDEALDLAAKLTAIVNELNPRTIESDIAEGRI